jgi:ribosomal protein S27AE
MFRRSAKERARRLVTRAAGLLEADRREAERLYREALAMDPDLKEAWFDLGLICKWERRWEEAFDTNLRAAELEGERAEEPAWWNLGIAATALRRWDAARRAWAVYGVDLVAGSGPIEADLGVGPVRLNPDDDAEVVWGHRIDPARMRIMSIPYPKSGHRWSDVVLHDGSPNGYREVEGQRWPVFDELMRWEPSDVPTVSASVSAETPAAVDELLQAVDASGYAAEDWSRNVRTLCKRCSEGVVHAEHSDGELSTGHEHFIGLAAPFDVAEELIRHWEAGPGRVVHGIEQVL